MKVHLVASHDSQLALCGGMDSAPRILFSAYPSSCSHHDFCTDCQRVYAMVGFTLIKASIHARLKEQRPPWVRNSTRNPDDLRKL